MHGIVTPAAAAITGQGITARQLYDAKTRKGAETADYFVGHATMDDDPRGANGLIVEKSATSVGAGQKVRFFTREGFYGAGKQEANAFTSASDFETPVFGQYDAQVNCYRHATSTSEYENEQVALTDLIEQQIPEMQGAWEGRLRTRLIDLRIRQMASAESYYVANGKTVNNLISSDILDMNGILSVTGNMMTYGGTPARIGTVDGQDVFSYVVGPVTQVVTTLKQDSNYQTLLKGTEMGMRHLLKGSIATFGEQAVVPYNVVNHAGVGNIGSARMPMGRLGVAIASGTGSFHMKFHATDTTTPFTQDFLGYAFPWITGVSGEVVTSDPAIGDTALDDVKYVLVVNPSNPGGSYVPNATCVYAYTANDGNKLYITGRLKSGGSGAVQSGTGVLTGIDVAAFDGSNGISVTKYAGYTTATGATLTDTHPVGALVYQCNSKGVPLAFTPFYGAGGILRPLGKKVRQSTMESEEGGFLNKCYHRFYVGTALRRDSLQRTLGVATMTHAVKLVHTGVPVVTS